LAKVLLTTACPFFNPTAITADDFGAEVVCVFAGAACLAAGLAPSFPLASFPRRVYLSL
jgi:hypothetical protein